jgi:hypothetical protein
MIAVIGIAAKEMIELRRHLVHAIAEIQLRHRQLVLIGKQDALCGCAVAWFHGVAKTSFRYVEGFILLVSFGGVSSGWQLRR